MLASDIVVAAPTAQFGLPEPRRGIVAGIVAPLLAFRVGGGTAARLLLTSSLYPADEAHRLGIYHELIDEPRLWARCVQLGEECAAGAPEAVQLTKRLLYETIGEHLSTQLSVGAAISATSRTTEAAQEGLTAFRRKTPAGVEVIATSMPTRRVIKSVLHNFLGTYTSRYSDYNGYWLFGFMVE